MSPAPAPTAAAGYPLGLRVAGRRVVVVGGGSVALRRATALVAAGADVRVVAPAVRPVLADLADRGALELARRAYEPGDLEGAWLAFACTSDPVANRAVASEAEQRRIWCVRADDAAASAAWTPATGRVGALTVAVHADRDPRRAAAARDLCLDALARAPVPRQRPHRGGRVVLVGGGPGDPGLITVRGRDALLEADVVVVDRLAPLPLLDGLGDAVEVVDVSKVPGGPAMPQEDINRLLVERARAGRLVVRLKGGDPFVFGRGMEEVQACLTADVPVEIVPGVTSAVAVPALAGIPVTHRGVTQSFTVVSGHVPPGHPGSTVDWAALARSGATLVLLMAMDSLPAITAALLEAGLPPDTPAAAVQEGASSRQRVVKADLAELAEAVVAERLRAPAVVVIGAVAGPLDT